MKILHTLQLFPRAKHQYFQELIPFNWTKEYICALLQKIQKFPFQETLRARRKASESQRNSAADDGIFLELAHLSGRCGRRDTVSGISARGSIRSVNTKKSENTKKAPQEDSFSAGA